MEPNNNKAIIITIVIVALLLLGGGACWLISQAPAPAGGGPEGEVPAPESDAGISRELESVDLGDLDAEFMEIDRDLNIL